MKRVVVFVALLIIALSGWYFYNQSIGKVEKESAKQISVSLNSIVYQINEGKTSLDLLKKYSKVETKGEGVNAYVVAIDGKKALSENKEYWAFYVNGKLAEVGAGSYKLKQGDKIEWKIEKY